MHGGALGFAFAKVLAGADGALMVPHFRATDVVADNRLLPQQSWSDSYRFSTSCADPLVRAVLVYRPYAVVLARQKRWTNAQSVMVERWQ